MQVSMNPSGKLPEPENPPIMNLGCPLDTIFANFRAMFFRLLQGVQQIRSRIETKGRKQKKSYC